MMAIILTIHHWVVICDLLKIVGSCYQPLIINLVLFSILHEPDLKQFPPPSTTMNHEQLAITYQQSTTKPPLAHTALNQYKSPPTPMAHSDQRF